MTKNDYAIFFIITLFVFTKSLIYSPIFIIGIVVTISLLAKYLASREK
jgi:hypothetical protein